MTKPKTVVDALLKSAITGKPVMVQGNPIISIEGVHLLIKHKLWPEALQRIAALDAVHPDARLAFLQAWKRMQFRQSMPSCISDDLFYASLRKMLPPYNPDQYQDGQDLVKLYRGQEPDAAIGHSWTLWLPMALRFAMYGFGDPETDVDEWAVAEDGIVLTANVPTSAIICAPWQYEENIRGELEFIIDPRRIAVTSALVVEFDDDYRSIAREAYQ